MIQNAIYERQNMIHDLKIPKIASVVGCGGTGFWSAILLAMSGVQELILVDDDLLEMSNLNRIPVGEEKAGMKKTKTVSDYILNIRKQIRIEVHDLRIEKPEDCSILRGDVFCCTDNLKSQQLICAYCQKNNILYQRIGYDGTLLNVSKAFPLSFSDEVQDGYTITPSWVVPAVLAASAGVSSRLYKEICLMDDMAKIHIQDCSFIPDKVLDKVREEEHDEIVDNIHDYIPDGYGYCDDCHMVDPDNGYGYCDDCDKRYTEEEYEEEYTRGFFDAVEQIRTGNIEDEELLKVVKQWKEEHDDEEF